MKKLTPALLLLISLCFSGCSVEEVEKDPDLVSKWELMEILQSEGGEAVYRPTDQKETIEFWIDSKVKRSTSWCPENTVTVAEYSTEDKLIKAGCGESSLNINYEIKGNFLFIYPNCVEECALKYRRIDNLVGFTK